MPWPEDAAALIAAQHALARAAPAPWRPVDPATRLAALFTCFPCSSSGPGTAGDRGWVGVALVQGPQLLHCAAVEGRAAGPYEAGLLAWREGPLLEAALRTLPEPPELLMVNASGRDHPRRVGLALHLGAQLELPSFGVTDRPLLAQGAWPADCRGAWSRLALDDEEVARWLRVRVGTRPLVVHPGWRVDLDLACALTLELVDQRAARTPWPLRLARQCAREARARAGDSTPRCG